MLGNIQSALNFGQSSNFFCRSKCILEEKLRIFNSYIQNMVKHITNYNIALSCLYPSCY